MSSIPRALARPSSKPISKHDIKWNPNFKYRTDELNEPAIRLPGVRSLLPLPGGDLLTGGTDLKIHYWDHSSPDRSYSVCGPSTKGIGNDEKYDTKSIFGVQVVQVAQSQVEQAANMRRRLKNEPTVPLTNPSFSVGIKSKSNGPAAESSKKTAAAIAAEVADKLAAFHDLQPCYRLAAVCLIM